MRGLVARRNWMPALLLAVFALNPALGLGLPTGTVASPPNATGPDGVPLADWLAWIDTADLATIERRAAAALADFGPSPFPRPTDFPLYAGLSDEERREGWRAWLAASILAQAEATPLTRSAAATEGGNATPGSFGTPRGLQALWGLESHGGPRELLPADADGGTFLVTDRGVLKFPAPGAAPEWMVKPGGYLTDVQTTDANGDGVLDLVIGVTAFYGSEDPSLLVVDGAAGTVLFTGLTGEQRLFDWTLTDLDADGRDEILGMDHRMHMVAYELDGTNLRDQPIPQLPRPPPTPLPFVYVSLYNQIIGTGPFADVNADGVKDLLVLDNNGLLVLAVISYQRASLVTLTAYSGVDGTPLWRAPVTRPSNSFAYAWPLATGDLDGDGRDDILLRTYEITVGFGFFALQDQWRVFSGLNGVLVTEGGQALFCGIVTCQWLSTEETLFFPERFADLDGDGAAELVGTGGTMTMGEEDDMAVRYRIWFEGRAAPPAPRAPATVLYQHEVLAGTFTEAGAQLVSIRDVDADGKPEALVMAFGGQGDEDGALAAVDVHLFVVRAAGASGGKVDGLYGFWDADATGTFYGWSVDDDRWGPVDASGQRTTEGFRLIISIVPLQFYDHTGDKVPDLLLRKSLGYMWVDGRNGRLLDDVVRPLQAEGQGVYEERGRLYLLEYDYGSRLFAFFDIETGVEAWRMDRETLDGAYLSTLVDVTGDGRLDGVAYDWSYVYDFDEGPVPVSGESRAESSTRVFDMTTGTVAWEHSGDDAWASFADALVVRPGDEILLRTYDDDTGQSQMALHVPGEEAARWTYNLGDGHLVEATDGYLLVRNEQEGEVYEILAGASGEVVSTYPLPADTETHQTFFTKVNGDKFPDLVVSFVEDLGGDDLRTEVVAYDWASETELARFELASDGEERLRRLSSELYLFIPPVGFASANVGDWDRDGMADFAYREVDQAVVRSTRTGEILALAPGAGTVLFTPDLNGDGRLEAGMVTDRGRLRFFAYEPKVTAIAAEDESAVRVIRDMNGTETDEAAERFFERAAERGLPGPALGLVLALLVGAVAARRRGRGPSSSRE